MAAEGIPVERKEGTFIANICMVLILQTRLGKISIAHFISLTSQP